MITRLSSESLDDEGRGYPRPQLQRDAWMSLNGEWEFALDAACAYSDPDVIRWNARIQVPFARSPGERSR